MRESQIEAYFVKRVKELGGWQRKFVSPNCKGVPDRVVMFNTWVYPVFVEFKATDKPLRDDQVREHTKMERSGCVVRLIDSIEKVDRFLAW